MNSSGKPEAEKRPPPQRVPDAPSTRRAPVRSEAEAPAIPLLQPIWELNIRCLSLLAETAEGALGDAFPLVRQIRESLIAMNPEIRNRAARKSFLLLDLEFSNLNWWQTVVSHPSRSPPLPAWRGRFPRASARALARATLSVVWHGLQADRYARCRFGMLPAVAALLQSVSLTELERLAERRYQFLRPRWEDRPAVWRQLLESAATTDYRRAREFNIRGLQLLVGELLATP